MSNLKSSSIYMNIDSYRLHPNYQEDDEDDEDDEFFSSSEDDDFYDEEHIYSVAHPKGCNLGKLKFYTNLLKLISAICCDSVF